MILEALGSHRFKRAQSDVQCDFRNLDSPRAQSLENLGREVESCRRRSHRASLPRIDRLIPFPIERFIRALDVWWQRNVTKSCKRFLKTSLRSESHNPQAIPAPVLHTRFQLSIAENDALSDGNLSSRPHE